jgi:integrase
VKTKIKPPKPKDGASYTLTELIHIVNYKLTRGDAQLIVCLAGLMGLRPSEIVALCWENVNLKAGRLRLHQAYVRGHPGTTKTGVDVQLPMLKMVIGLSRLGTLSVVSRAKVGCFQNRYAELREQMANLRAAMLQLAELQRETNQRLEAALSHPITGTAASVVPSVVPSEVV